MSEIAALFFFTLNLYLSTFHESPAHAFLNDNAVALDIKIERMATAVETRTPIR